jgi:hypothetical protein
MAKVQVFLPEPPQEFNPETFRQINIAIETLQNSLNTNYQNDLKNEQDTFNYVKSKRRKRPGRHAKHHKGKKRGGRGQGFPI